MNQTVKIRAYLNLTLAMFISGSAVVASKMMVQTMPTFLATELGILIGMLILLPLTFFMKKERHKLDWKTHIVLFAQALCGIVLYRVFTFVGLRFTTAADSGLITSAAPVFVVLLAFVILKEKMRLHQIVGMACVVIGLLFINLYPNVHGGMGNGSWKGNVLLLSAVLCEALFSTLSKVSCMKMSAIYRTTIIVCYAFVLLLPMAVLDALEYDFNRMGYFTIGCIFYYGIFVSFLSYILWFRGIEKVQANHGAVFTSVVPVSSILLSAILLKESITVSHIISMVFIMVGIWITCIEWKQSKVTNCKMLDKEIQERC
jgi:drug/metabolite transporter (DMT)-like permease